MKLCELIPGQRAEVVSVNAGGASAARLRALGDALAETGDAQIIDRIGEVLARYEAMPAGEARALYFEKKKHRLGETK